MYVLQFKENKRSLCHQIQQILWIEQSNFSRKGCVKAWLTGVSYSESIKDPPKHGSLGFESWDQIFHKISQGLHTPASQSHQGMILRWVNLPSVCDPRESLIPRGVNSHFFTHLDRPLKGQWHKNKCELLFNF